MMPIAYQIDPERQLVVSTATGVLTDADVLGHKQRLADDPRFGPGMRELSDVRGIEGLAITPAGVRAMVGMDEALAARVAGHRLAIVASDDVAFGMARMYQGMTEPTAPDVRIFRDLAGARAWLGLD